MTTAQALKFEAPDQGEETARADLYGLLAALFYAPPPAELLAAIAASSTEGEGILQQAWGEVAAACRQTDPESLRELYESLFIGVGKPDLMLYGSYYMSGFLMEKPLAALRADLDRMGLQRDEHVPESEDHIATLCEVMRYLIASDDALHANLATQKQFFADHLQPWVIQMCDAVIEHPQAGFYAAVAQLAKSFFEVEMQAFDMA
ncbi:molecular chaperone TorD family protein [Noviherbaspirillum sp. CPCC 100848]|uniref:Molecular chaperone TorD family protein n=1 Tax=Noviherbaspirillum album TaxID=3080276 RepID=A0ABU6J6H0_9BURK|nr:molecular chaperone TorD family protein [Noviherbaspirillum sp. CPCC 100848]MEC4718945.1 molecular chaperone TorD family protein [Noviherbaspirillum sp. CPCC 100848]